MEMEFTIARFTVPSTGLDRATICEELPLSSCNTAPNRTGTGLVRQRKSTFAIRRISSTKTCEQSNLQSTRLTSPSFRQRTASYDGQRPLQAVRQEAARCSD